MNHSARILPIRVDGLRRADAVDRIFDWLSASERLGRYVCAANVHMCMEAKSNPGFRAVVNGASLVVPDGRPLYWVLRLLRIDQATHIRGSDLMLGICREAAFRGVPVGLYGGSLESMEGFHAFLSREFPSMQIACAISPPFRPLEDAEDKEFVDCINASGARILFVGLGCPKQEMWMAAHQNCLNCVMVGIGAAFDFYGGKKREAPSWLQRLGMEWFFRLLNEPNRLWRRYAVYNTMFLLQVMPKAIWSRLSC